MRLGWFVLLMGCNQYNYRVVPDENDGLLNDISDSGLTDGQPEIPEDVEIGGVTGEVCSELGPIEGAKASIEHSFGVSFTYTDAEGRFLLENIPVGTWTIVIEKGEFHEQFVVTIPENEILELATGECGDQCTPEVPCIGLAEAVDRHAIVMSTQDLGIKFDNVGEFDICLDEWYVLIGEGTQDAAAGETLVELAPGESTYYPYARDIYIEDPFETQAWWCVEREQSTQLGGAYDYNGSLLPTPLFDFIYNRTDVDNDDVEDHIDFEDIAVKTQVNIWDTIHDNPMILVGRDQNLIDLVGSESATVTVEVRNLGKISGSTQVFETVPVGFVASNFQPPPVVSQALPDGSISYMWEVSLDGAVPSGDTMHQVQYDIERLSYEIHAGEGACEGRCVAERVLGNWSDSLNQPWISESEPLIIEYCPEPDPKD